MKHYNVRHRTHFKMMNGEVKYVKEILRRLFEGNTIPKLKINIVGFFLCVCEIEVYNVIKVFGGWFYLMANKHFPNF